MKKIFASTALLFVLVVSILGQPGFYYGFSPESSCLNIPRDGIVFVGRIDSSKRVDVSLDNKSVSYNKSVIVVEKVFRGKIKRKVEVYWGGGGGYFYDIKEGDQRIFVVNKFNFDKLKVLESRKWSRKLNNYSKRKKEDIFSQIKSSMREITVSELVGAVIKRKNPSTTKPNSSIDYVRYNYLFFETVPRVDVEVKRKKDGKIFRTKTNDYGSYRFIDLPDGYYKIRLVLPKGYKEVKNEYENRTYKVQKKQL